MSPPTTPKRQSGEGRGHPSVNLGIKYEIGVYPNNVPMYLVGSRIRLLFAYTDSRVIRIPNHRSKAIHSDVQALPLRSTVRCECVPVSINRCGLPIVRRVAPVFAVRSLSRQATFASGEAGSPWAAIGV
jgi:hypothetical protein